MATLTILIVTLFVIGYLCIALESLTRINKAAIALLMCVGCWTLLMMGPGAYYPEVAEGSVMHHIAEVIEHHLGDAGGTLFFLMGAMTIVEIVTPSRHVPSVSCCGVWLSSRSSCRPFSTI